jgi:hypothetical protein
MLASRRFGVVRVAKHPGSSSLETGRSGGWKSNAPRCLTVRACFWDIEPTLLAFISIDVRSVVDYEGTPNALLGGNGSKRPVVATDVGGLANRHRPFHGLIALAYHPPQSRRGRTFADPSPRDAPRRRAAESRMNSFRARMAAVERIRYWRLVWRAAEGSRRDRPLTPMENPANAQDSFQVRRVPARLAPTAPRATKQWSLIPSRAMPVAIWSL